MKLFKNGVGRPSNEIKEARRIFIVSIITLVVSLITLLVCFFVKDSILTEKLKGAAAYSVSYGIWSQNKNDIKIDLYPEYNKHNGTIKFPEAPKYTEASGKTCTFKGWIFQKLDDGRYRMHTTSGQYVWYRANLDSGKYKVDRYAFFGRESGTQSYKLNSNISVRLYAAFDCKTSSSSGNGSSSSTSSVVSKDKIKIVYEKNASEATGSMATKEFNVNSSIKLDKNKYNLDGHNFGWWQAYKIVNGAKKYYNLGWTETSYKEASMIKDGIDLKKVIDGLKGGDIIHLEAHWVELKGQAGYYTIVFKPNGGSGSMSDQKIKQATKTYGSSNLKGNSFSRVGYKFKGWKAYRIVNGSKKYFIKDSGWKGTSNNGTLIGNKADIQKNYADEKIYTTYDIDRFTSPGKYIYLEAQWNVDDSKWLIEIDKNGGTLKSGKSSSFTLTKNGNLPNCYSYLSRNGYTCTGWKLYRKDMNGGRKTYYTGSTNGWKTVSSQAAIFTNTNWLTSLYDDTPYGITIYAQAQWKKNTTTTKKTTTSAKKWTVVIDRNGGTASTNKSSSINLYSTGNLPYCYSYAEKTGYKCTGWKLYRKEKSLNGGRTTYFTISPKKGWQTTNSGSAEVFKNNYKLSNIKDQIGPGVTFYARIQWVKK